MQPLENGDEIVEMEEKIALPSLAWDSTCDDSSDPVQVFPRIGDQYQVKIPPFDPSRFCYWNDENESKGSNVKNDDYEEQFAVALSVPIMQITISSPKGSLAESEKDCINEPSVESPDVTKELIKPDVKLEHGFEQDSSEERDEKCAPVNNFGDNMPSIQDHVDSSMVYTNIEIPVTKGDPDDVGIESADTINNNNAPDALSSGKGRRKRKGKGGWKRVKKAKVELSKASKQKFEPSGPNDHGEKHLNSRSFIMVPGSSLEAWTKTEEDVFLLALYIFGKNFTSVQSFMETKKMKDILVYYYTKFYGTESYCRWAESRKIKSRKCFQGQRIFSGWRQQELSTRLLPHVPDHLKDKIPDAMKGFTEGRITIEEFANELKTLVGLSTFVQAIGIGKGSHDLTAPLMDPMKTNQVVSARCEIPMGRACSSLSAEEIVKFLTGDYRLSKARSNDLFWEAVWPRLLARGWHSEQPDDQTCLGSKQSLVFLIPGVQKFSRRILVKGVHYFDSLSEVLSRVALEPRLLDPPKPEMGEMMGSKLKPECLWTAEILEEQSDRMRESPCYLQPRYHKSDIESYVFTIIDTSLVSEGEDTGCVRQNRMLPTEDLSACLQYDSGETEDPNSELLVSMEANVCKPSILDPLSTYPSESVPALTHNENSAELDEVLTASPSPSSAPPSSQSEQNGNYSTGLMLQAGASAPTSEEGTVYSSYSSRGRTPWEGGPAGSFSFYVCLKFHFWAFLKRLNDLMDNKFQSLLMESWSPEQGVSPDFVVCGGSPEMEFEAQDNSFSFNSKIEDYDSDQYDFSERKLEEEAKADCLTLETEEQEDQCQEMEVEAETDLFSFDCKEKEEDHSLTVAMFPEVHSPLAAEGWSEIPLKTPIKKEEEEAHFSTPLHTVAEDRTLDIPVSVSSGCRLEDNGCQTDIYLESEASEDLTLCNSLARLVTGHQDMEISKEDTIIFINAGEQLAGIDFQEDLYFVGGDIIRTEEAIVEKEDSYIYQTARFGNFSYVIGDLPAGHYIVDLHFAEIIFTNGPPGMRVFDVFIQEEKILSEFDIYARVGANTPLVLMDAPVNVIDGGNITIRFEAIIGSPIVSAICIRQAPHFGEKIEVKPHVREEDSRQIDHVQELKLGEEDCNQKCRSRACKTALEYKRKFEELDREFELKKKECHEAWISLEDTNRQLDKLRNELMRKSMHVGSLAYAVEGQVNELRDLQDKHESEKKMWVSKIHLLSDKLKMLKSDCVKVSDEANSYVSSFVDMSGMTSAVQALLDQHEELKVQFVELKAKFVEECKERKQLYNKLLELKGNIRVFCRCRPLSAEEIMQGAVSVAEFDAAKDCEINIRANGAPKKVFRFDSVFTPQDNQEDVFANTAPVAVSVLDGFNVCIFAYGQTGTGKTFTMEGTEENRGVNYRTLEELFRVAHERKGQVKYDISVSVLEVYNEQIRDLLAAPPQPGQTIKKLEVKQVAEGVHHVPGLVEAQVHSMSEVWEVLQTGSSARAVGSTNANEHSSRSHCILCVMVRGENLINGECTRSKLWLVDLAGSERVAKTDVQGERLKEAQNINKSLSALGDVISSLATKNSHIPFRNSKLTHLLQDSLGGDSKTLMFVQISPNENDLSETLCSLNFASRVRGIELGPARKQIDSTELLKYKQMVEKAKHEGKSKDASVKKMEETVQSLEAKLKGREQAYKSLQDKVKELEGQLAVERKGRITLEARLKEQQQQQAEKLSEKPPLMRLKNINEASVLRRDLVNLSDPLTENRQRYNTLDCSGGKPQDTEILPRNVMIDPYSKEQKENNAELCDHQKPMPRRTGRASICTTSRRTSFVPPARRVSMVPLPVTRKDCAMDTLTSSKISEDVEAISKGSFPSNRNPVSITNSNQDPVMLPSSTPVSLRGLRTSNTLNRLRRSIHKKVQLNSPILRGQHNDLTAGERAKLPPLDTNRIRRISSAKTWGRISGTGNISAQRVLCSNRSGMKPPTQLREKERIWNR